MEFKEAMRIWKRMCISQDDDRGCDDCPLCGHCGGAVRVFPDKTEAILAEWAAVHPERTIADDFFEKHPKAKKDGKGAPIPCASDCGYGKPEYCETGYGRCAECWWRPLEEKTK